MPLSCLLLILTVSAVTSLSNAESIVIPDQKPTITTTGTAERDVSSDESRISLAVENTNANANTARKNNADKMDEIVNVLKQAGLTEENITTSSFQITPNYDYENSNYDRIISYTAINKIELKTSTNANISQFIDLAVNAGANRVENIDFVVSKKTLDKINLELLDQAFRSAKEKADVLAHVGNFSILGVKDIDTSSDTSYTPPTFFYDNFAANTAEKAPGPSTQIIPQKNKIMISLPVVFYISNPVVD
ncbi:SIMPL domain-containing protein [Candidatus Nitrosocosmicus agrestis]|uniref:SIMPL domain-containing protein n=1 Tax=Candidatus Nitrosocosmicus agrestis TaxID=2563600 RepID=UPI001331472C|nr:SIMPL domain-containing protein [Candidatus Nitrosocosmicus sp. SS]